MTVLLVATWIALGVACLALVASGLAVQGKRFRRWASRSLLTAWGAVTVALAVLVTAFLTARLDVFYVWQNVEAGYPWWLRLAGVWGGQAGTFLLWSWVVLGAAVAEDHLATTRFWHPARLVLVATAVILLVPTVVLDLGAATSAFGLTAQGELVHGFQGPEPRTLRPDGQGLNPLLESPYMAIHPLVEFLAYGLTAVPFAYGLTYLFRGGAWRGPVMRWARPAWLAFLTALTLGALWAYIVLSFGGYWIWDPVEVGNLLPFLALTLTLHAVPASRKGWLGFLAPASAVLAFTLIVFADFVVRSGLWSSVHAFLPTGLSIAVEDPGRRLLIAVRDSFQARYAASMAAAAIGTSAAAFSGFHARRLPRRALTRRVAQAGVAAYGLVAIAGLVAPEATVAALHQLMLMLGFGVPLVGAVVLALLAVLPLGLGLAGMPEEIPLSPRERSGQLVLASSLFVVTIAAVALLLVLGVNGYGPEVFESRAPALAAAFLVLVGLAFHRARFERWAWVLAGAVGLGLLARLVTGTWALAAVPVTLVPAAGAVYLYACRASPTGTTRERVQALVVVLAGVLGLVHWASPGSVVLDGISLSSPAWYLPIGLLAGTVAVLSPYLESHRGVPTWLGPAAAILAVGYGVGAVLGLVGLYLAPRRVHGPRGRLTTGAVPLIHVGMALVVLGVAMSTYGASTARFDQADPLIRGEPRSVGAERTVELVDGEVLDADGDGRVDTVSATVHVREQGSFVAEETLTLEHHLGTGFTSRGSFVPQDSPITRGWWGDLAHNADTTTPLSIRLTGGNETWITANGPPPRSFPQNVDAVSMGVKTLPAVNVLWGAIPLIGVGMAVRWLGTPREV